MRCMRCEGHGLVPVRIAIAALSSRTIELPCPACRGTGRTYANQTEIQEPMARQDESRRSEAFD